MGQDQSQPDPAVEEPSPPAVDPAPAQSPAPAPSSLEELAAEAMSFSEDDESIDVKVQKALDCPCVADLKTGPCGSGFVDAFSCFLRSTEVEKGSDCVQPFIALQNCIKENPAAFSREILEEEKDEEAEKSNLKVRAPAWSRESKPKL